MEFHAVLSSTKTTFFSSSVVVQGPGNFSMFARPLLQLPTCWSVDTRLQDNYADDLNCTDFLPLLLME
jgi:hypothetical protein